MQSVLAAVFEGLGFSLRATVAAAAVTSTLYAAQPAWQDGSNDPSFNVADDGRFGYGPNGTVETSVVDTQGRVIVGGFFTRYNATDRGRIARVLGDGSVDPSFPLGSGANGPVRALLFQPDGKLLVGGGFHAFSGVPRRHIVRLDPDGSLDTSFVSAFSAVTSSALYSLALQPDGRILVGGSFTQVGGVAHRNIARLMPDGQLDPSFSVGVGPNTTVQALALQSDGHLLVGGGFASFNGSLNYRGLVRLTPTGALDATFNPTFSPNSGGPMVKTVLVQPDQRIFVGGWFSKCNNVVRGSVARLHPSGALDVSFDPGAGGHATAALAVQNDGKLVVGGAFIGFQGAALNHLVRLEPTGLVDASFQTGTGPNAAVYTVALPTNGTIVIGGGHSSFDGQGPRVLTGLLASGSIDANFNPGRGLDGRTWRVARQSDGKYVLGGEFTRVDGYARRSIARLNADGTVDTSFDPGQGPDGVVLGLALQADGKTLIGGEFEFVDQIPRRCLARLTADGAVDPTFAPGSGVSGTLRAVHGIVVQPDGRIVFAGEFTRYNSVPRNRIARAHPDGSLDLSFDPGLGPDGWVYGLALQPDGKLLLAGAFKFYSGLARRGIVRILDHGGIDPSFNPGSGVAGIEFPEVRDVAVLPDGEVAIGGKFTTYNGVARARFARLLPSGALDLGFDPGLGANGPVYSLASQPDGKLLLAGQFSSIDSVGRACVARVNTDGSVDSTFLPGPGANGVVIGLNVDPAGRAVIAGDFARFGGVARTGIARMFAFTPAPVSYCTSGTTSSGCTPALVGLGAPSAVLGSGFTLQASQVDGQRAGLLLYRVSGRAAQPWGTGGTSWLCVKSPTQRMSQLASGGTAGQCDGVLTGDWNAWTATRPGALGQPFATGDVVNAQAWFRDPPAPKATNLSNALEFALLP